MLVFILLINVLFSVVSTRSVKGLVKKSAHKKKDGRHKILPRLKELVGAFSYKIKTTNIGTAAALFAGITSGVALILILGFILAKGLPELLSNPHLLIGRYEFGSEKITILPSIAATLMAVLLSLIIAVPVGIMTAVFLNEYTKKSNVFIKLIRTAIDILAGVPSIVYGLFGMITFVRIFGGSSSILSGSLTVSIMLLPTIVRATE